MAINLVGKTVPERSSTGASITHDLSGLGLQQDDVVLVALVKRAGTPPTLTSSGWTSVSELATSGSRVFYKKMGATPDSSVVSDATGVNTYITAYAYREVDTSTQIDVASPTPAQAVSTNPDSPAITTVTGGCAIFIFAVSGVNDASITAPSGYGDHQTANDTSALTIAMAWKLQSSAGTEDPPSWTAWSSGSWTAHTVALRPAVATSSIVMHPWRTTLGTRTGSRQLMRSD